MAFFTRYLDRIKTQSVLVLLFLAITGTRAPAEIVAAADDAPHPFGHHFWGTNGFDIFNRNPGNVGIGTLNPSTLLAVGAQDPTHQIFSVNRPDSDIAALYVGNDSDQNAVIASNNADLRLGRDLAGAFTEHMVIQNNSGNVGIGTDSPNAPLHIESAAPGDQDLLILELSPADEDQVFWGIDFRRHGEERAFIRAQRSGNSAGDLLFGTRPFNDVVAEERLRITSEGLVGIGTSTPTVELEVIGDICATGTIGVCSDARFKKDVEPMAGSLSRLLELRGVEFDWKRDEFPDHRFSDRRQIGFIAQEVLNVLPSVVSEGSDGSYSVDYGRITPVLVEAIKELHQTVEDRDVLIAAQGQQIEDLMARLDRMDMMMARLPDVETRGAE